MNNKQGHPAGDRMLREVAAAMQSCFGPKDTYRIGGDEFVGFKVDVREEKLSAEIDQIRRGLEKMGYHVSFGRATSEKTEAPMDMIDLVKRAENKMFAAKRDIYSNSEQDRRSR